jgi:two-component system sensor histidine kinase PilS (NtrC family)
MPDFSRIFAARGASYIVLLILLGVIAPHIVLDGSPYPATQIFLVMSVITFGQFVSLFLPLQTSSLLALFFCDATFFTVLVRVSGASSSPFLVLFPILAALGPVVFRNGYSYVVIAVCVFFSGLALGWSLGSLGVWVATFAVGFLSQYLIKLLQKSDTALVQSEAARRRLENLQKAILANIPSGLVSIDSEGRIIQMNDVGQKILGVREEAVLQRPVCELVPGLDFEGDFSASKTRQIVEYLNKEGQFLKLGYSIANLKDPDDNRVLGTLFVFQDLTYVLKMEADLRMSEKLAAIGKLAAGIAHEIRNPLAGISGSAQLLAGSKSLEAEDKQLLAIIQRESTRLDALITEFLEYVRPQEVELKALALNELVGQCVESLRVNSKWLALKSEIETELSPANVHVMGEANKIIQVLLNFILNAGQAGATRVQVHVSDEGVLEVRDNGSGISPEHRKRLFEPFFTTKDKGTGLGLAISYKVLEAMGARIEVISPASDFCEKGGSIFRIKFRKGVGS